VQLGRLCNEARARELFVDVCKHHEAVGCVDGTSWQKDVPGGMRLAAR
jgi:hypothetical protein